MFVLTRLKTDDVIVIFPPGLALSAEIGALKYLECSAIKSEGLEEVNFLLITHV